LRAISRPVRAPGYTRFLGLLGLKVLAKIAVEFDERTARDNL